MELNSTVKSTKAPLTFSSITPRVDIDNVLMHVAECRHFSPEQSTVAHIKGESLCKLLNVKHFDGDYALSKRQRVNSGLKS